MSIQLGAGHALPSLAGTRDRVQVKARLESSQCLPTAAPGEKDLELLCPPLTSVGQELQQEQRNGLGSV